MESELLVIVDDDERFLEQASRALAAYIKVVGFSNCSEAWWFIMDNREKVVGLVVDWGFQNGEGGIFLAKNLRQESWTRPIIFVTAEKRFEEIKSDLTSVMAVVYEKPIEREYWSAIARRLGLDIAD